MRQIFHDELEQIASDLVELAGLVATAIRQSTEALLEADVQLADRVIEGDRAIDDRRNAARAAGLLAIVGVALLPVIRYSVVWWNSLHQGQTIRMFGESSMDPSTGSVGARRGAVA